MTLRAADDDDAGKTKSADIIKARARKAAATDITAREVDDPLLGTMREAEVDTLMPDYCQSVAIPHLQWGKAAAITGNLGSEGLNMIYFDRQPQGDFFFTDALRPYITTIDNTRFYNNKIPMTLLSYNTGGGRYQAQDRLNGVFNGNINRRAQVGATLDYLHSKGSYDYQAGKHFNFGFNGSYMGDHYQVIAAFNQFNSLNKENGGITDDLYITDPAEIQGGSTDVDTKNIPTNLTSAHSRVRGKQLWMNHKYRLGFYHQEQTDSDSVPPVFVPVTAFSWTMKYQQATHVFRDDSSSDDDFWDTAYFTSGGTYDETSYWSLSNVVAVSLLEGFNKYAKAGLSAYAMHEIARYNQTPADTVIATGMARSTTEQALWVGGRLSKQQGALLRYDVDGRVVMAGDKMGDLDLRGEVATRVRMIGDTVTVRAYGSVTNTKPEFFLRQYVSNHFMWNNDFGRTRRVRFGGELNVPQTATNISVGVENVQNLIYFGEDCLPVQNGGSIQVMSASLNQNFHYKLLHWQNRLTYQTASNSDVLSLPQFSVYSNLFLLFHIATMKVQFGVDCTYSTSYYAMGYQPATMSFYNQRDLKVGNYPMCDLYANMKLDKVRFYVLFSHVNQGLFGGSNYFSAAHYPLNPRRFLLGLSIDFTD
jgi:hypothetical protein